IERKVYGISSMSMASRLLIAKLVRITLMIFAVLMGVTLAGVDLSLLTVFSGAVGLGIGFGLQRGVSNLFTGMMLLLDKTIQPNDVVELPNGAFGVVRQMGARYTEIITLENKSHLVPNENMVTNTVINWSRNGTHIMIAVDFRTEYDHDPKIIMADAIQAALSASRVLRDPPPICNFNKFGDLGLEYTLQFWIADPQSGVANVRSEVLLAIWERFRARDVTLPNLNHSTFGSPKKEEPPPPEPAPTSEPS
ncbi:MAG TPA: mechanosensitive ion channel domain-containing protein, partial [Alphaproteobacteria bacterium]